MSDDNVYKVGFDIYKKSSKYKYNFKTYKKIVTQYLKYMTKKLLDEGVIYLPNRFGQIEIFGYKPRKRYDDKGNRKFPINWGATNQLWKKDPEAKKNKEFVYIFNEHTNGLMYKINWNTKNYIISSRIAYTYKPAYGLKKELSERIKSGKEYKIKK